MKKKAERTQYEALAWSPPPRVAAGLVSFSGSIRLHEGNRTCFFSSRRRHTILTCDWSSDVCSSDLIAPFTLQALTEHLSQKCEARDYSSLLGAAERSEERRVGQECRSRWSPCH